MTRSLLKLMSLLLAVFAMLCAAPLILGRATPHNSTLAGFTEGCEGQPQPCWYGIVPEVTAVTEVPELLMKHGFSVTVTQAADQWISFYLFDKVKENSGCNPIEIYWKKDTPEVQTLSFHECEDVALSDILFLIQYPGFIDASSNCDEPTYITYPFAGISIENNPTMYGINKVSDFNIWKPLYNSLDEFKSYHRDSTGIYITGYTLGASETTRWKFLRVFLERSVCG